MSESNVLKKWATHYDSKKATLSSRTELADWLIKGVPMDEAWFTRYIMQPALEKLELEESHDVLEIGCGSGLFLVEIDKLVRKCIGTDLSETMMSNFEIRGKKIKCAAHELPFPDNSFDRVLMYGVVVCFPSFEYFKKVVNRALRTLRHKGIMLIGDVPFDAIASRPPNIHYNKHSVIDYLDSLDFPYSIFVPHYEKRQINSRQDIIIYKD